MALKEASVLSSAFAVRVEDLKVPLLLLFLSRSGTGRKHLHLHLRDLREG